MIKAASWCKDAVPSQKGWVNPKTGEVLKAVGLTDAQISEWCAARAPKPVEVVEDAPADDEPEWDDE